MENLQYINTLKYAMCKPIIIQQQKLSDILRDKSCSTKSKPVRLYYSFYFINDRNVNSGISF